MSEDTEQIRRETEAKWSGALAAIVKYATISKQQSGLLWHEAHQIEKQTK
jgi:hypothetical protein